eukprot:1974262-Amphidinium_carterae.1
MACDGPTGDPQGTADLSRIWTRQRASSGHSTKQSGIVFSLKVVEVDLLDILELWLVGCILPENGWICQLWSWDEADLKL